MSKIYVTATPIGNLGDISKRALEILGSVDLILAEDTRVTRKLLSHFEIKTPTESFYARNEEIKIDKVLGLLSEGKELALVSDAGTPTISDPGARLIMAVREKSPDTEIIAVPGASAVTAALSISGLPSSEFLFLGFLPHKKGRQTLFKEIAETERTVVFYESPHRILKALESLEGVLDESRKVVIAREITKMYEEVVSGSATEVFQYFQDNPDKVRGEYVVMVS